MYDICYIWIYYSKTYYIYFNFPFKCFIFEKLKWKQKNTILSYVVLWCKTIIFKKAIIINLMYKWGILTNYIPGTAAVLLCSKVII